MRIIKNGEIIRQTLNLTCKICGCEFEIANEEIRHNMGYEDVKLSCPCCGMYLTRSRNQIVVHDKCAGCRCLRESCYGCEWEFED